MRRMMLGGMVALACAAVLTTALPAKALVVAPNPLPVRMVNADLVVVGKVTAIEDKGVMARFAPGVQDKREYRVAVVEIQDTLKGTKGLTKVRVGFLAPPPPVRPGGPIISPGGRFRQPSLTVGQEACLFLTPHFEETFFLMPGLYDAVNKQNNPNYDKEVGLLKRAGKLLDDPKASLKAKDPEDRLMTVAMLLTQYRTPKGNVGPKPRMEPVDAELSKLILEALADADWTARNPQTQLSAQMYFYQLGVTAKDGWTQPKVAKEFVPAAKKWLKENSGTFRIQRYATEKPAEK